MGKAAILFNGEEAVQQIVNTLSTESPMWNLVKIATYGFREEDI